MLTIRHSVWLTLLVAAAAAVVIMPSPTEEPFTVSDPLRTRLAYVNQRFTMQSEMLRREHSRSLARDAMQHLSRDAGAIVFVRPPDVPVAFEQRIRASVTKGFATLFRHDSQMRVVYVLTIDTGSTVAGATVQKRASQTWSLDVFPPGTIAANTCVEVVRAHDAKMLTPARKYEYGEPYWAEPLGPCWWYAAYGTPGRGVATWLDATHYAPIQRRGQFNREFWDWVRDNYEDNRAWTVGSAADGAMTACAEGRVESCAALALTNDVNAPDESMHSPDWIGQGRDWNVLPNTNAAALLRRLQSALGPDEFAKLWKSDASIPDAFRTIHGGSFTEWIQIVARQLVPENREHALPSLVSLIAVVAGAIGLILLGTRAVARRSGFA